jgi:hypothetical protein
MAAPDMSLKMVTVNAERVESVGYIDATRHLYIKFRNSPTVCYEGVPRFRYQGLLASPRPDAYFDTYVKHSFLGKPTESPPGQDQKF